MFLIVGAIALPLVCCGLCRGVVRLRGGEVLRVKHALKGGVISIPQGKLSGSPIAILAYLAEGADVGGVYLRTFSACIGTHQQGALCRWCRVGGGIKLGRFHITDQHAQRFLLMPV